MEVNLKFNIPEDQDDFDCSINGYKYRSILWELSKELRDAIKYNRMPTPGSFRELKKNESELLEELQALLRELIEDQGINSNTLY